VGAPQNKEVEEEKRVSIFMTFQCSLCQRNEPTANRGREASKSCGKSDWRRGGGELENLVIFLTIQILLEAMQHILLDTLQQFN